MPCGGGVAHYRTAHTIEDEERIELEAATLHDRQASLVAKLCSFRATTLAGHLAGARKFVLVQAGGVGLATREGASWDKRLMAALVRDQGNEDRA